MSVFTNYCMRRRKVLQPIVFILIASLAVFASVAAVRKNITLSLNGEELQVTTFQNNVADVLHEAGVIPALSDLVEPAPEEKVEDGMLIVFKQAFPVVVKADGLVHEIFITQASVNDVLTQLELQLGELDRVEPAGTQQLAHGDEINVIRVERRLITQRTEIPFREIKRGSTILDRGDLRVIENGIKGIREDTVEIVVEDGMEVSASILQSDLLQVKHDRIVEYGENTVLSRGGRTIDFTSVFSVSATAYCPGTAASGCPMDENGCSACTGKYNDGITATGRKAIAGDGSEENPHLVAVDPRIVPLGSRLYIDGYGFAIAADTGSAIKGYRLDLLLPTHQSALQFGRRQLRVYHLHP